MDSDIFGGRNPNIYKVINFCSSLSASDFCGLPNDSKRAFIYKFRILVTKSVYMGTDKNQTRSI